MGRDNYQRGRSSGRGRGGKSSHATRGYNRGKSSSTNKPIVKEVKFAPQVQGKPQQATFATVKEAVLQNIQKNYKYGHIIAQSLEEGTKVDISGDKPDRQISQLTGAAAIAEQKGFDIEYQERLSRYLDKEDSLDHV